MSSASDSDIESGFIHDEFLRDGQEIPDNNRYFYQTVKADKILIFRWLSVKSYLQGFIQN